MKIDKMICYVLALGVLAACGKTEHSVEYYKQHSAERDALVAQCRADPDLISKDPNCRTAGDAQFLSGGNIVSSPPKNWTIDGPASATSRN
jgi:hypothetical protein